MLIASSVLVNSIMIMAVPHLVVASQPVQRAAEAAGSTDVVSGFLQYGVLGLVVVGFATRWLVTGAEMKQVQAENIRLQGVIEERLYPMIEKHAVTMDRVVVALDKTNEALDRNSRILDVREAR